MIKVSAIYQVPKINVSAYKRAVNKDFSTAMADAARVWLQATTVEIPVWSGASLATFAKLANEAGFALGGLTPVFNAPSRVGLGLSASQGSLAGDSSKAVYNFTYATSLRHLIYNEFNNANVSPDSTLFGTLKNPGPYRFQVKGKAAVLNLLQNLRLPDLNQFITIKTFRSP